MDILNRVQDEWECYKIMVEVFMDYIPDEQKLLAMSHAAERIFNEVKNCEGNNNG